MSATTPTGRPTDRPSVRRSDRTSRGAVFGTADATARRTAAAQHCLSHCYCPPHCRCVAAAARHTAVARVPAGDASSWYAHPRHHVNTDSWTRRVCPTIPSGVATLYHCNLVCKLEKAFLSLCVVILDGHECVGGRCGCVANGVLRSTTSRQARMQLLVKSIV